MEKKVNKKLSFLIETSIAQSHRSFTERYQKTNKNAGILELGKGGAFFSGVNSPFSQVVGWGFRDEDPKFLDQIENFYSKYKMPSCFIELSPFVGNTTLNILSKRGYLPKDWSQISYLLLDAYSPKSISDQVIVKLIKKQEELEKWSKVVASGFNTEELSSIFCFYGSSSEIYPFGAWVNGTLCGGGTVSIYNETADLGVTSTLNEFRGKGVQKALLAKRLEFVKTKKIKLATVTTNPGSISDINTQKMGFSPAYTRLGLIKYF